MADIRAGQRLTADFLKSIFGNIQGFNVGSVTITPVANVVTTEVVSGLTTQGDNFAAFAVANTTVPGIVAEVAVSNVTATSFNVHVMRSNTTLTAVWWMHVGYSSS